MKEHQPEPCSGCHVDTPQISPTMFYRVLFVEADMLTTHVQFEAFKISETGEEHWLGYYIQDNEIVASFMKRVEGTRRWKIIEPPAELSVSRELLSEFVHELQVTTNARALVTPDDILRE